MAVGTVFCEGSVEKGLLGFLLKAAERFARLRRERWFRWWSFAAMAGFVLVLLFTDKAELTTSSWGVLAATLLVVGFPWLVGVLVDALITGIVVILSSAMVVRWLARLGLRKRGVGSGSQGPA
ncbi:MAG: hypothetical protein EXR47_06430 [Dehalococcoidia bacterium]|nr:hypothetical protein [Dehalococcoidia bacterium]